MSNGGISFDMRQFARNVEKLQDKHERDVRKTLRDFANIGVGAAVDRAPILEGMLGETIEGTVEKDAAIIRVPVNSPAADYAVAMHEDEYNLGELSAKKQARMPEIEVGRKYITRGIDDSREDFIAVAKHNLKL